MEIEFLHTILNAVIEPCFDEAKTAIVNPTEAQPT